jgi:hypothetical protein
LVIRRRLVEWLAVAFGFFLTLEPGAPRVVSFSQPLGQSLLPGLFSLPTGFRKLATCFPFDDFAEYNVGAFLEELWKSGFAEQSLDSTQRIMLSVHRTTPR